MKIVNLSDSIKKGCKRLFVAFDVETTGLNPAEDKIIEIGATVFVNESLDKIFKTFVNPGQHIPEKISEINHITDQMVENAPGIKEALRLFYKFLEQYIEEDIDFFLFSAHNAKFDKEFLSEARRTTKVKEPVEIVFLDTLAIAREKLILPNYKLGTVADAFGIEHDNDHSADSDSVTCGKVLLELLPDKPITLQEKARITLQAKKQDRHIIIVVGVTLVALFVVMLLNIFTYFGGIK